MRRVLSVIILGGLAWCAGLFVFAASLPQSQSAHAAPDILSSGESPTQKAVIVYTGGAERIASAVALLERGAGSRLLISGVHPDATSDDIARRAAPSPETANAAIFACCIDLGRQARTTIGNAQEAAQWAQAHQYNSLILVTSDYHMPRAMLETRRRLPDVAIAPFAVYSGVMGPNGRGRRKVNDWGLLAGEYTKYLAAWGRAFLPQGGSSADPIEKGQRRLNDLNGD